MKSNGWWADRFRFRVKGKDAQRFVNEAVRQGIRLAALRRENDGFTAEAFGMDCLALRRIAAEGDWSFAVLTRRGPGRWLEMLAARPGVPAGMGLFCLLLCFMGNMVWKIDFGVLDQDRQQEMRSLLANCGIYEGVLLEEQTLEKARSEALRRSDLFGWISLNFTGGCLYVENTEAEYQEIQSPPAQTALYAKENGVILSVQAQSGFVLVELGQTVEAGQLLVDDVKLDRSGREIRQGASGKIVAMVEKSYTAFQPYQKTCMVLNGKCQTDRNWYFLGQCLGEKAPVAEEGEVRTEWIPLSLGRLSLPGCVREETLWSQEERCLTYSDEQARALARRECRKQLYKEFPDAVIEAEQKSAEVTTEGVYCTIQYQFRANIAVVGESTEGMEP